MKRDKVSSGSGSSVSFENLEPRLLLSGSEWLPGLVGSDDFLEHTDGQVINLGSDDSYDLPRVDQEFVGVVGLAGNGQAEQGIAFIPNQGWVTSSGSGLEDSAITWYDSDWNESLQIVYEGDTHVVLVGTTHDGTYNVKHIGDVSYGGGYVYAPLQLDYVGDSDEDTDWEYIARFTAAGVLDTNWDGIFFDPATIQIGGVGYYGGSLYAAEFVKSAKNNEWSRAHVLKFDIADSSYESYHLSLPYINGIAIQNISGVPFAHLTFGGGPQNGYAPVGVTVWDVLYYGFSEGTGAIAVVPLAELTAHTNHADPLEVPESDYFTYLSRPHAEGLTFDGDGDLWVSRGMYVAELDSWAIINNTHVPPGLGVVSVTAPPFAEAGSAIDVSTQVRNDGGDAASYQVEIRISADQNIQSGFQVLGTVSPGAFPANSPNQTINQTLSLAGVADGSYYIGAMVTTSGDVDTSNNWSVDYGGINIASAAVNDPDLSVASVSGPGAVLLGSSFDAGTTVENRGSGDSGSYTVEYRFSTDQTVDAGDYLLATFPGRPAIPAGDATYWNETLDVSAAYSPGEYYLIASVSEVNDNNSGNDVGVSVARIQLYDQTITQPGFQYPVGDAFTGAPTFVGFRQNGHVGIDYGVPAYTDVVAAADGVVTYVGSDSQLGNVVIINHYSESWGWDENVYSLYGEIDPAVAVGDSVSRGDLIGYVSMATGGQPGLHFEIRSGANAGTHVGPHSNSNLALFESPNTYRIPNYHADVAWHDPSVVVSGNLYDSPAPGDRVDLVCTLVTAPGSAKPGEQISVSVRVQNQGTASSGPFGVDLVFSANSTITGSDPVLTSVTRPGLAGGATQMFNVVVTIPGSATIDEHYWVGARVDPANSIVEYNDGNNDRAAFSSTSITDPTPSGTADLIGTNLELSPALTNYAWGAMLQFQFALTNIGDGAAPNSHARFYLADHPSNPTYQYELTAVEKPIAALPVGRTAQSSVRVFLPSSPIPQLATGDLYLRMVVDGRNEVIEIHDWNNEGRASGQDWVQLPRRSNAGATDYDLMGDGLTISPPRTAYEWGEQVNIYYTYKNAGPTMSQPFEYFFYLSPDRFFSPGDWVLAARANGRTMDSGDRGSYTLQTWLPAEAECGLPSGPLYVGVVIDPYDALDVDPSFNNQGRGLGIDYLPINIVPPPPLGDTPEPQIGSLVVSPGQIIRGQKVELTAFDVLDDINAVYDVEFRVDANFNGIWDSGDLYVGHGSKSGTTFTTSVYSNTSWPTGDVTILARAKDNFGLVSEVATATLDVLGSSWGPIVPDIYENNDSLDTAYRMGGPGAYNITGLSHEQADADYYAFDVIGDDADATFAISFFQDDMLPGQPEGDLDLDLYRYSGSGYTFIEDSRSSWTGATGESIQRTNMPSGRYIIGVTGDPSGDYSLNVSITNPPNAPESGPLLLSKSECVQGETVRLAIAASQITGIAPDQIEGVGFYLDRNDDAVLSLPELLGVDWGGPGPAGDDTEYWIDADTSDFNLGENRLVVLVFPKAGIGLVDGLAQTAVLHVAANNPPYMYSVVSPDSVIQGDTIAVTAYEVMDDEYGSVETVEFYLDTHTNGSWDADDLYIGQAVQQPGEDTVWDATVTTGDWPLGDMRILAVATDNLGAESFLAGNPMTVVASTNVTPTIGSLVMPESVIKGDPLPLLAASVTDPMGDTVTVQFFADTNYNLAFDQGDLLLEAPTAIGDDWSVDASTAPFINGAIRIFAVATDDGIPPFSTVVWGDVNIIDQSGPRVVAHTPTDPVLGSIDMVTVTFDEPIDPDTFTIGDVVSLTGPSGSVTIEEVSVVGGTDDKQFEIRFAVQSTAGSYNLILGPDINDVAGLPMDQDEDGIVGEGTDDRYSMVFQVAPPAADFDWAYTMGGGNWEDAQSVGVDGSGNIYLGGIFQETIDFDPDPIGVHNESSLDRYTPYGFIAKYDENGQFQWVNVISSTNGAWVHDVHVTSSGTIYATGEFTGTANFGSGYSFAADGVDGFLWKINSSGSTTWAAPLIGTGATKGYAIAADSSGNAYVAGSYSYGTVTFGGSNHTSAGGSDIFVVKYSNAGSYQWAKTYGGAGNDVARGIAVDPSNNPILSGYYYSGSLDFGGTVLSEESNGFCTSLNSGNGSTRWARATGGAPFDIAVDSGGSLFLAGSFSGTVDFNPAGTTLRTAVGNEDVFVAEYTDLGTFLDVMTVGGSGSDNFARIAIDSQDNLLVTGRFSNTVDFNPSAGEHFLSSQGEQDIFILKMGNDFDFLWARAIGSTSYDQSGGIAAAHDDGVIVAGALQGVGVADPGGSDPLNLPNQGSGDIFFARLSEPAPNHSPTLSGVPALLSADEDELISFQVSGTDIDVGQTLTYSAVGDLPGGASFNPATRWFTWQPGEDDGGNVYSVTFRVTDSGVPALSDTETCDITVVETNQTPVLDPVANVVISEGETMEVIVTASDADGDSLTFYLTGGNPAGATIDSQTGQFSWATTEAGAPAVTTITVGVTDGLASTTTSWQVDVREVNASPTIGAISDNYMIIPGDLFRLDFTVTDSDVPANDHTWSLLHGPSGMTINSISGVLLWPTLGTTPADTYDVIVQVSDNGAPVGWDLATFSVTVAVPEIDVEIGGNNDVHSHAFGNVTVGQSASATFTIRNEGTAALTVRQASGLSAPFVISPTNGADSADDWTITPDGTHQFTVTFAPTAATSYDSTLTLLSNDDTEGNYEINLAGAGDNDQPAQVVGQFIFYNNSYFDGNDAAPNVQDDNAIATDKQALLPGQTATFANYTSYSRGINGIMIDIDDMATTPGVGDFAFKAGNSNDPSAWAPVAASPSITVRSVAGGSDRVTILWDDNAIQTQWLQVTVLSDDSGGSLGLAGNDVFYFANLVGNCDGDGEVASSDYTQFAAEFGLSGGIGTMAADFNADGWVDLSDFSLMRGAIGNSVLTLTIPAAAPQALSAGPVAALQAAAEPIAGVATPIVPVVSQPLGDNDSDANDNFIATTAFAPAVDLLAELPSTINYISGPQPISVSLPATTLYRAATTEYDLRPLGDDLTAGEPDDLSVDILAESPLALPL